MCLITTALKSQTDFMSSFGILFVFHHQKHMLLYTAMHNIFHFLPQKFAIFRAAISQMAWKILSQSYF